MTEVQPDFSSGRIDNRAPLSVGLPGTAYAPRTTPELQCVAGTVPAAAAIHAGRQASPAIFVPRGTMHWADCGSAVAAVYERALSRWEADGFRLDEPDSGEASRAAT